MRRDRFDCYDARISVQPWQGYESSLVAYPTTQTLHESCSISRGVAPLTKTASRNLPGYVVLSSGVGSSGGATLWQSGFLPTSYAGVPFRNQGEPVLNLKNPSGLPPTLQKKGIDLLSRINSSRYSEIRDPEISSRIASYELAYRMQMATPELINLGSEPKHIQELYGIDRPEPKGLTSRGKSGDTF